jgi:eukaryotic-like serine/threonine-protein kinase
MGFLMRHLRQQAAGLVLLVLLAGCSSLRLVLPPENGPHDWPMDGGNPSHSSVSADTLVPPLESLWSETVMAGTDRSACTATATGLVVGTLHGELQAYDAASGEDKGSHKYASALYGSPVLGGTMIIVSASGDERGLLAVESEGGRVRWSVNAGESETSPLAIDSTIISCTLSGKVLSIGVQSGSILWRHLPAETEHPAAVHSSPAGNARCIVYGDDDGVLTALRPADGSVLWTFRARSGIMSAPVLYGGCVYFGSLDSTLYALDAETGRAKWTCALGSPVLSSPAAGDGRIWVGVSAGSLICIGASDGKRQWSFATGGAVSAVPVLSGNVLYAGGLDKFLYALDAATGSLIWKKEFEGRIKSAPLIAQGRLIVLTDDRLLTVLVPEGRR